MSPPIWQPIHFINASVCAHLACECVGAYIRGEAEERERDEVEQHSVHSLNISDDDLIKG